MRAQHHSAAQSQEKDEAVKVRQLITIFEKAEVEGHIRNYFMSTINEGSLKDYYTNATGGAIGIKTLAYKGFRIGVKGIFTYQTFLLTSMQSTHIQRKLQNGNMSCMTLITWKTIMISIGWKSYI